MEKSHSKFNLFVKEIFFPNNFNGKLPFFIHDLLRKPPYLISNMAWAHGIDGYGDHGAR